MTGCAMTDGPLIIDFNESTQQSEASIIPLDNAAFVYWSERGNLNGVFIDATGRLLGEEQTIGVHSFNAVQATSLGDGRILLNWVGDASAGATRLPVQGRWLEAAGTLGPVMDLGSISAAGLYNYTSDAQFFGMSDGAFSLILKGGGTLGETSHRKFNAEGETILNIDGYLPRFYGDLVPFLFPDGTDALLAISYDGGMIFQNFLSGGEEGAFTRLTQNGILADVLDYRIIDGGNVLVVWVEGKSFTDQPQSDILIKSAIFNSSGLVGSGVQILGGPYQSSLNNIDLKIIELENGEIAVQWQFWEDTMPQIFATTIDGTNSQLTDVTSLGDITSFNALRDIGSGAIQSGEDTLFVWIDAAGALRAQVAGTQDSSIIFRLDQEQFGTGLATGIVGVIGLVEGRAMVITQESYVLFSDYPYQSTLFGNNIDLQNLLEISVIENAPPEFTATASEIIVSVDDEAGYLDSNGQIVHSDFFSMLGTHFDDPDGDTLSFSLSEGVLPAGLTLVPATGQLLGTIVGDLGEFNFVVTATDTFGAAVSGNYTFIVTSGSDNNPPVSIPTWSDAIYRSASLVDLDASQFFSDPDGDILTFSTSDLPDGLSMSIDGLITGVLTAEPGLYPIHIIADDGRGGTTTVIFNLTVSLRELSSFDFEYMARTVAYQRGTDRLPDGFEAGNPIQGEAGFFAVPITGPNGAAVLAIRGTADWFNDVLSDVDVYGIGYSQAHVMWPQVLDWLERHPGAHIVGHSLGGAQAQLLAAWATEEGLHIGDVTTFNSPGINSSQASRLNLEFVGTITHYIAAGDVVSMAGRAFLPGSIIYYNFETLPLTDLPITTQFGNAHVGHWSQPGMYEAGFSDYQLGENYRIWSTNLTVDDLSARTFSHLYSGMSLDVEYAEALLAIAKIKVIGPPAAALLTTRGTTEDARTTLGLLNWGPILYQASLGVPSWDDIKAFGSTISEWSLDQFKSIANWDATLWTIASELTAAGWGAIKSWSADTWNNLVANASNLYDRVADWGVETVELLGQLSQAAWSTVAGWPKAAWSNVSNVAVGAFDTTRDWTIETWENLGNAASDIWSSLFGGDADEIQMAGNDYLVGTGASEALAGLGGDDIISGLGGNDEIDGGSGIDTALYSGPQFSYTLVLEPGATTITDRRPGLDGTDNLSNMEFLDFTTNLLNGPTDLTQFGGMTRLSPQALESFIELYIAYFNRAPDAIGLNFWGTAFANGTTLAEMAALFGPQEETLAAYPLGTSNEVFASTVYNNVLGRTPDQAGIDFWVGQLDNGNVSREQFILEVLRGAKSNLKPEEGQGFVDQQIADQAYLENKVDIGAYFAVHRGMSNVNNASDAMALYNGSQDSIAQSLAAIDAQYQAALDPLNGEFLMQVVGVLDNPIIA